MPEELTYIPKTTSVSEVLQTISTIRTMYLDMLEAQIKLEGNVYKLHELNGKIGGVYEFCERLQGELIKLLNS